MDAQENVLGSSQYSNLDAFPIPYEVTFKQNNQEWPTYALSARIMCENDLWYINAQAVLFEVEEDRTSEANISVRLVH